MYKCDYCDTVHNRWSCFTDSDRNSPDEQVGISSVYSNISPTITLYEYFGILKWVCYLHLWLLNNWHLHQWTTAIHVNLKSFPAVTVDFVFVVVVVVLTNAAVVVMSLKVGKQQLACAAAVVLLMTKKRLFSRVNGPRDFAAHVTLI